MPLSFTSESDFEWTVRKICVVGPGIVGMPMAALLADARIKEGSDEPARVLVVQRNSRTSGWKVDAINAGRSVIGGIEPGLDDIVSECVAENLLSASHDCADAADADVILVCVQTDKAGFAPDYGPMFEALENIAAALRGKPAGNIPVIVFESTLAPTSMTTVVKDFFAERGLQEGKDILLGNSPNRVMPGRLVERVAHADKLAGGLHPLTPKLIARLYANIVTQGTMHQTNSMTAEVVKTLENAYRDVRIAFATEIVRYCDANDIDFYAVRDEVNRRIEQGDAASHSATAVPSGGVLVPMVGVGGHCLPKDGILLWWRRIETGEGTANSLILNSRAINDDSPARTIELAEQAFGSLDSRAVALLGAAYRFDSEDTRNSPTLDVASLLRDKGSSVRIHDPFVKPTDQNLEKHNLQALFTNDAEEALRDAEVIFFCTGHSEYEAGLPGLLKLAPNARGIVDGANLYARVDVEQHGVGYTGIGRGVGRPSEEFIDFVKQAFEAVERGAANEVAELCAFYNARYAPDTYNKVSLDDVRQLAATCATGCVIAETATHIDAPEYAGFTPLLARCAADAAAELASEDDVRAISR